MKISLLSNTFRGMFFAFIICLFVACTKEENSGLNNNPDLKVLPRSPGSYSINTNGILEFPTDSDFHQTATYIFSDTTYANLTTFRNSLGISTIAKRQEEISDSLDQNTLLTSAIVSNISKYKNYVDTLKHGSDIIISNKYGDWSEFLNLSNLVKIGGYLYKITDSKVITILDGDVNKISTAEGMEETDPLDTSTQIIVRHAWSNKCNCNVTGKSWKEVSTKYTADDNNRSISELTFTNLTTVKYLNGYKAEITPHWTIKTFINIQHRGTFGAWKCDRHRITFNRQIQIKHTFASIPSSDVYNQGNNYWNQSTGWLTASECEFKDDKGEWKYPKYTSSRATYPLDGYCLAIHTFAQTANITNPVLNNSYFHWLYYALFPLKWPFMQDPCLFFWDDIVAY